MSYGEPWGLGFLEAIFEPDDLKNAGLLMGGGAVAFTLAPWALSLIKSKDPGSFIGKYGVWLKTAGSLAGGYALYKWGKGGGSWYKDLGWAAGAVLLALGGSTILKKVLDLVGVTPPSGMIALAEGPSEMALLEALNAIEDRPLLGMDDYAPMPLSDGGIYDGFQVPQGMYEGLDDGGIYDGLGAGEFDAYGPSELQADSYKPYPMAGLDGPVMVDPAYQNDQYSGIDADVATVDGLDADVFAIGLENPQGLVTY